jgi:hypothetical protein
MRLSSKEDLHVVPCPSPPDPIHSELIDELDQIRELRKARDSQYLDMSNRLGMEQIRAVRCPTCGAEPGEKCELNTGQPRTAPHRDRRLATEDLLSS